MFTVTYFSTREYKSDETTDKTRLNKIAQPKDDTWKPLTRFWARRTIKAFITQVNRPSVKILKGKVKISNKGFINVLTIPRTIDTNIAVIKSLITTPFNNIEVRYTASALTIKRKTNIQPPF